MLSAIIQFSLCLSPLATDLLGNSIRICPAYDGMALNQNVLNCHEAIIIDIGSEPVRVTHRQFQTEVRESQRKVFLQKASQSGSESPLSHLR